MNNTEPETAEQPFADIVDYILGITYEIWEEKRVHQVRKYYTPQSKIYTLKGIIRGAEEVERGTAQMLAAFPDRLVMADNVVWSREAKDAFYTSHRITSPMTNLGDSEFGPQTGRRVVINTIADCIVKDNRIHDEWLVRDNLGLVEQLGFDPHAIARRMADAPPEKDFEEWRAEEIERVKSTVRPASDPSMAPDPGKPESFAAAVLAGCWSNGEEDSTEGIYAPYAVLHDCRQVVSGARSIRRHYAGLRTSFRAANITVDHVCVQPAGEGFTDMAIRWALAAPQAGPFAGASASGAEVLILGITHWRLVAGRIATEWTVFDKLAVLAQMYRHGSSE